MVGFKVGYVSVHELLEAIVRVSMLLQSLFKRPKNAVKLTDSHCALSSSEMASME